MVVTVPLRKGTRLTSIITCLTYEKAEMKVTYEELTFDQAITNVELWLMADIRPRY